MHEALTLDEALAAYTTGVAFQAFCEHEWGSLEPGMEANFLVLAQDLRQLPVEQISSLLIDATYLRGEAVFVRR